MTLDFFYNNYDLKNSDIKSVEIKNNKLIINMLVIAHLELIANGYRPELDVNHEIEFIFDYESKDKKYNNPIINDVKYIDNKLIININNDEIIIVNNDVLIKKNS